MTLSAYLKSIGKPLPEKKEIGNKFYGSPSRERQEGFNDCLDQISSIEIGEPFVPLDKTKVREFYTRWTGGENPSIKVGNFINAICSKFGTKDQKD